MESNRIKETFIRGSRAYVKVEFPINGRITILQANYTWLMGNPAFEDIPKGYVIHHLDGNELNDDISNLVLMQKHHHAAYHFKQKVLMPKVHIRKDFLEIKRSVYFPTRKPRVFQRSPNRFYLQFRERLDGERKIKNIYSWEGQPISTREMAEKIRDIIWAKNSI